MNKFTAEKYIDAIFARYIVNEKDAEKLRAGQDLLNQTFGNYYWSDIEDTIAWYYTHKNDKTRPTIAQMQDALKARGIIADANEPTEPLYTRPHTNLWSIQQTFDKLVNILIDAGVFPNDNGEFKNTKSLINPQTDLPILNPWQWLKWQLQDAHNARPEVFNIPNATMLEEMAMAVQNHLIQFKIRDWAKLAQAKKGGNL